MDVGKLGDLLSAVVDEQCRCDVLNANTSIGARDRREQLDVLCAVRHDHWRHDGHE